MVKTYLMFDICCLLDIFVDNHPLFNIILEIYIHIPHNKLYWKSRIYANLELRIWKPSTTPDRSLEEKLTKNIQH